MFPHIEARIITSDLKEAAKYTGTVAQEVEDVAQMLDYDEEGNLTPASLQRLSDSSMQSDIKKGNVVGGVVLNLSKRNPLNKQDFCARTTVCSSTLGSERCRTCGPYTGTRTGEELAKTIRDVQLCESEDFPGFNKGVSPAEVKRIAEDNDLVLKLISPKRPRLTK